MKKVTESKNGNIKILKKFGYTQIDEAGQWDKAHIDSNKVYTITSYYNDTSRIRIYDRKKGWCEPYGMNGKFLRSSEELNKHLTYLHKPQ